MYQLLYCIDLRTGGVYFIFGFKVKQEKNRVFVFYLGFNVVENSFHEHLKSFSNTKKGGLFGF